jgi:hypothetical protein
LERFAQIVILQRLNDMFEFLHRSDYINAKHNEDYFHFGFVEVPSPDWQMVLNSLDLAMIESQKETSIQECRELKNHGFIFNFPLNYPEQHLIFTEFIKAIARSHNGFRERQTYTAFNFLSLSSISETLGRHTDVMDVWCWQILGGTHITVEGKGSTFDKILEPGELIYIPRGMYHATKSVGPRSLISFGAESIDDQSKL